MLRIMLAHFGKHVPAREVRQVTGVSRDCLNAADIRRAARAFGLVCDARSLDTGALAGLRLPVVVHLRFIHFVVLERIGPESVRMNCPANGIIEQSLAEFDNAFTGIVLDMRPGPEFVPDSAGLDEERRWWFALAKQSCFATAVAGLLFALRGLSAIQLSLLLSGHPPIARAPLWLCVMACLGLAANLCLDFARRRASTRLRDSLIAKLRNVGSSFYVYRLPHVLFECFFATERLTELIFTRMIPAAFAVIEILVLLCGVVYICPRGGVFFTAILAAWLSAVLVLTQWRRGLERSTDFDAMSDTMAAWSSIENPAASRLGDGPGRVRLDMEGYAAQRQLARVRVGIAPSLLPIATYALAIACFAAALALQHSPGSPPAVPGSIHSAALAILSTALAAAAAPLVRLRDTVDRLRRDGWQIRDVLNEPDAAADGHGNHEIAGIDPTLVLENVSFGFNPNKPPIIRNVSLVLNRGSQVGLTGPSGDGKTTLTEIMVGLLAPVSGRVLVGGVPLSSIPAAVRTKLIARIGRPVIFQGSVRDNITLWDRSISEDALSAAIRDAALDSVLADLPGGLDSEIESGGRNLSGGQLQRIEIARALVRNPGILVLDDALDGLDFATEMRIHNALRRRGCTLLVVTHRAASLQVCDRIIQFAGGEVGGTARAAERESDSGLAIFGDLNFTPAQPVGSRAHALCLAFSKVTNRAIGHAIGIEPESIADLERGEAIARLAHASGFVVRPIRMVVDRWWRFDFGNALAFRTDGSPVALIRRFGHTVLFDPVTGRSCPLSSAVHTLDRDAWTFSAELDEIPTSAGAWMRRLLTAVMANAILASLLALVPSVLVCLLLARAARPLTSATLLDVTALALSCALFVILRCDSLARLRVRLVAFQGRLVRALLVRADPQITRSWKPYEIFRALNGLYRLDANLLNGIARGGGALALLTVLLAAIWRQGACDVMPATCGVLLALAAQSGLAFAEIRSRTKQDVARIAADNLLTTVLTGMRRFLTLDRVAAAFDRWVAFDQQKLRTAAFLRSIDASRTALRLVFCLLPVTLVCIAGSVSPRLNLAFASLAGLAASELGDFLVKFIRDQYLRQAASAILSSQHETGKAASALPSGSICAESIAYQYPTAKTPLFQGISLEVDPGSITVLAGPSGAGKSTLLRLLLHLQHPQQGQVRFGPHSLAQMDLPAWRRGIAGVFQGDSLEQTVTLRGQLATGGFHSLPEIWNALEFVELASEVRAMPMGLQTIVSAGTLSNGQQQRLLIARALLARPRLLVLDEATNAIPERQQASILVRLRNAGIGCLIVTHRQSVIEAADAVHVIDHGLKYSGPPAGLRELLGAATAREEDVPETPSPAPEASSSTYPVRPRHPFRPEAIAAYERPVIRTFPLLKPPIPWKCGAAVLLLAASAAIYSAIWYWLEP